MTRVSRIWLSTAAACIVSATAGAQGVVVEGGPSCPACSIEMQEALVIRSPERVGLTPMDKLVLAADGSAWVSPFAMRHALIRFGPDGTPTTWIDEEGQGPREFTGIRHMEAAPDHTLYAFGDAKYNRYGVDGEFLDTRRPELTAFRQVVGVVIFEDGSMVINGAAPSPEPDRPIFHLLDAAGEPVRSFGPRTRGFEWEPEETRRYLAADGPTTFWAATRNRYELELWDVDGTRHAHLSRPVDWFLSWSEWVPPTEEPPLPRIRDIDVDTDGRVWVLMLLPAENFAPLGPITAGAMTAAIDGETTAYDTLIEVLDPETGELVVRRRFPNTLLIGLLNDQHVVLPDIDDNGEQMFRIVHLTIRRWSARRPTKRPGPP